MLVRHMQLFGKEKRMARSNTVSRKKRYGQFFSGRKVADLLVNLIPEDAMIQTVLDPMVGAGDMLNASKRKYKSVKLLRGVDIDSKAIEVANASVDFAELYVEDAFSSKGVYLNGGWDLVITNPPYVRYQILSQNAGSELPSGDEVRLRLIKNIKSNNSLTKDEKSFYSTIAKRYSGLSDLAVPSWILCASLVAEGGYLAMVVPENWLNRDYATIVQYMLMKNFKIISITKDIDSSWFDDALVRTCLVVAQKIGLQELNKKKSGKIRCDEFSSQLIGEKSLVDKLVIGGNKGYAALSTLITSAQDYVSDGVSSVRIKEQSMFPQVFEMRSKIDWISDSDKIELNMNDVLPVEIKEISDAYYSGEFVNLEKIGWNVGQGLRTGANDFFYLDIEEWKNNSVLLKTKDWAKTEVVASEDIVRRVVQNRKEVSGLCINEAELTKGLLYIRDKARKSDITKMSSAIKGNYSELCKDLDTYIGLAEKYDPGKDKKRFQELSAVSPNEKKKADGYLSFWYMLPELKNRHLPDLCIPRINGGEVECLFVNNNSNHRIVVDANFTTLWSDEPTGTYAVFALLNSTWFKCYMELIGTTMGGGALKIEASHIKKAIFPKLSNKQIERLTKIGKKCVEYGNVGQSDLAQIDKVVLSEFCEYGQVLEKLKSILRIKNEKRGSKK